jgi:hypothetical protein
MHTVYTGSSATGDWLAVPAAAAFPWNTLSVAEDRTTSPASGKMSWLMTMLRTSISYRASSCSRVASYPQCRPIQSNLHHSRWHRSPCIKALALLRTRMRKDCAAWKGIRAYTASVALHPGIAAACLTCTKRSVSYSDRNSGMQTPTKVVWSGSLNCSLTCSARPSRQTCKPGSNPGKGPPPRGLAGTGIDRG